MNRPTGEWLFSDSQIKSHIGHGVLHYAIPVGEEDALSDIELALGARQERRDTPDNPRLRIQQEIEELRQLLRSGGAFSTVLFGEPVTIIRHPRIPEEYIQDPYTTAYPVQSGELA